MTIGSLPPDKPPDNSGQGSHPTDGCRKTGEVGESCSDTDKNKSETGVRVGKTGKPPSDRLELTQNRPGTSDKQIRIIYGPGDFGTQPVSGKGITAGEKAPCEKISPDSGQRLAIVRKRIDSGFYDRSEVVRETAARLADELTHEMEKGKDD